MADDPLGRALVDAGVVCRCCLNSRASDYKGEPLKAVPCPVCAPKATPAPHDTLCQRLQQRCSDWGVYWRAADAHGVDLSHAQAVELLGDALGVEVSVAPPEGFVAPVAPPAQPADGLRTALAGLVALFAEPDESHNDQFERVGELFRRDTGMLRPGKDAPIGCGHTYEERESAYAAWFRAKVDAARSALAAAPAAPAVQPADVPVPWQSVVKAIQAVDDEARRRGEMFPLCAEEHREDRRASFRVWQMIEWYATKVGAVAEKLRDWPRIAAAPAAPAAQPEGWRPTRLYIDGEWNSFRGELISMALVAEDGRHWYEELECRDPDPWVAANVIPKLEGRPVSLVGMRQSLHAWLAQFEAVHIVADWPEDIERFCWLLIRGPGERIDTPPLTMEVVRVDAPSANPHNALADARGLCAMLAAAPEREGGAS